MYNVNNYEYDCTKKCKCHSHGQQITTALTKRAIANDKLAAYIAKICCNFANITDPLGRSAVHMSASVDRYAILEWLLNQGSAIDGKDLETGSTALHRAIYYGCIDCAVLLIRYGANLEQVDSDTRNPLQNCCRVCDIPRYRNAQPNNDILVWGLNKNYNLGIGDEEIAFAPQFIDFFRKERISITMFSMSTYHSLFVDIKGHLYAAGHGNGGRLGNGKELSLPIPKRVKVPTKNACERIICVSTSRNHSLVLTDRNVVFACGLNDDMQLGILNAPQKLTSFKEVVKLRDFSIERINRVIARDFHSVAYSNKCLFVWGKNLGQFGGHTNNQKVFPLPKLVYLPETEKLDFVESNNFAIACTTTSYNIWFLYNHYVRTIRLPELETAKSISIVGGDNTKITKGTASALKLLVLTYRNVIFVWYELSRQFLRCTYSHAQVTEIDKIFYKANQLMVLSRGDVYMGKCHQVMTPVYETTKPWLTSSDNNNSVCPDKKIQIELKRIPQVDRAVDVFCDDDFNSFAVLQESCHMYYKVYDLPREEYSLKKLLIDANENDGIHDIVFHVDGKLFYAHKFIIFSRSPALKVIVTSLMIDKDVYLDYDLFTATMFEFMLKYIYANYFVTYEDFRLINESLGPECPLEGSIGLFLSYVQKFQLTNLANHIQQLEGDVVLITDKYKYKWHLKRTNYPQLHDVTIRCSDGVEIAAHKCVLVAQLEYFDLMFTHTWSERSTINLTTVPSEYMIPIVDFLYSLDVEQFCKQNYSESFLYNMIVFCDQFFIENLRKVCESLILKKVNIRKCGDILEFACFYNCNLLKEGCLDFICQNLYRVLSQKSLEGCQPEVLKCVNTHYRKMFKQVFDYRLITPDSEAIDDETLLRAVHDFKIDLDYKMSDEDVLKSNIKKKSKPVGSVMDQKKRQYEQDAINSMKQMNLQDSEPESALDKSKLQKEVKGTAEKTQNTTDSWRKVIDKKEFKKTSNTPTGVKTNEILKVEPKPKEAFVNLSQLLENSSNDSSPTKGNGPNFNLGDFTPIKSEKLSQKQRKRLSSETSRSEQQPIPTKPVTQQPIPNAWGISSPSQSSDSEPTSTARLSSSQMGDSPSKRIASGPSTSTGNDNTSFSQILDDELRQREYVRRIKNKSLVLTQIEETAIAELEQFYNVDCVDDEIITIERKKCPLTQNFAVWQKK